MALVAPTIAAQSDQESMEVRKLDIIVAAVFMSAIFAPANTENR